MIIFVASLLFVSCGTLEDELISEPELLKGSEVVTTTISNQTFDSTNFTLTYKEFLNKPSTFPNFSFSGTKHGVANPEADNFRIFNITDYGAVADDDVSDQPAIQLAINAAKSNGGGVIYFPRGRYLVHTATDRDDDHTNDSDEAIKINSDNIVLRGEVVNGTNAVEVYFDYPLSPQDPSVLYGSPALFQFNGGQYYSLAREVAKVSKPSQRGDNVVQVRDISSFNSRNARNKKFIYLIRNYTEQAFIENFLGSDRYQEAARGNWRISNSILYRTVYRVKEVIGNQIILDNDLLQPIDETWSVYDYTSYIEGAGIENLNFKCNFEQDYIHHRSWQDDGGHTVISFAALVDSWVKNVKFISCTRPMTISALSSFVTVMNYKVTGNRGHHCIVVSGDNNLFINLHDQTIDFDSQQLRGQTHSCGITAGADGNVFYKFYSPGNTAPEFHASQPRYNLFDNVETGNIRGGIGGTPENQPNHMEYLVLWNYKNVGPAVSNYRLWTTTTYGKIFPPIIVGLHGNGMTFPSNNVLVNESPGVRVSPDSLYLEQYRNRKGSYPLFLSEIKNEF